MKPKLTHFCLALAMSLSMAAQAADTPTMVPQQQNGVTFISGGIADDQQKAMAALHKNYNLHLTFATKKAGEFISDVQVAVQDGAGKEVVAAKSDGPLFFAQLEPGTYKVTATSRGKAQSQSVTLGKTGSHDMGFYWARTE
jgi:hypothetical protein